MSAAAAREGAAGQAAGGVAVAAPMSGVAAAAPPPLSPPAAEGSSGGGRVLDIRGIDVRFPFAPYDCQRVYMEKVVESLQTKSHALLESPTGTGKTLSLLCATLAWRQEQMRRIRTQGPFAAPGAAEAGGADPWSGVGATTSAHLPPKIYYASRTHSQITQVIKELRCTSYVPAICVLGSRQQLCIHKEVKEQTSNAALTHACRHKVANKKCEHHLNIDQKRGERAVLLGDPCRIMDVEDLVRFGEEHHTCPYYLSKENQERAELVLLPYNYLIDPQTRRAQNITLDNSVLIFDEAHNIESNAEDAASFDLDIKCLGACMNELQQLITLSEDTQVSVSVDELTGALKFFAQIEQLLMREKLKKSSGNDAPGITHSGTYIYKLLAEAGMTDTNKYETYKATFEAADSDLRIHQLRSSTKLEQAMRFFKALFEDFFGMQDLIENSYRVHIYEEVPDRKKGGHKPRAHDPWGKKKEQTLQQLTNRKLSFWCFNPGFGFRQLTQSGVHCVILTSGTLSPMSSFASELMTEFPIQLENGHVVGGDQVLVNVISKGPSGVALDSSYANRSRPEYKRELGNTMVNFARTIPKGLLVFFPSYGVLRTMTDFWKSDQSKSEKGRTIWARMTTYKAAVIEPQGKAEFVAVMSQFYDRVEEDQGCIFFAVCRGKVSEGLDFADNNGRAVVITGLPYPPLYDPKVKLKRNYLDRGRKPGMARLNGSEWYQQQASRAVNQAVGRVIRHQADYGAILLCDSKFARQGTIDQMSTWLKPHVEKCESFGDTQRKLAIFFKVQAERDRQNQKTQSTAARKAALRAKRTAPPQASRTWQRPTTDIQYDRTTSEALVARLSEPAKRGSILQALNKHKVSSGGNGDKGRTAGGSVFGGPARTSLHAVLREGALGASSSSSGTADGGGQAPKMRVRKLLPGARAPVKRAKTVSPALSAVVQEIRSEISRDQFKQFTRALSCCKTDMKTNTKQAARKLFRDVLEILSSYLIEIFIAAMPEKHRPAFQQALDEVKAGAVDPSDHGPQALSQPLVPPAPCPADSAQRAAAAGGRSKRAAGEPAGDGQVAKMSRGANCRLCKGPAKKPFEGPCRHVLCFSCWESLIPEGSNKCLCPVCNTKIRRKELKKMYLC